MATSKWVVTEGAHKIMEGTHDEVLSLINEHDPFIGRLRDGQKIQDLLVTRVERYEIPRTESEKALRAFTASIHKQIHDAADAAYRSETNKCKELLEIVRDRINYFYEQVIDQ